MFVFGCCFKNLLIKIDFYEVYVKEFKIIGLFINFFTFFGVI